MREALVLVLLLALGSLAARSQIVHADDPELQERSLRIERQLSCPTCTNLRLDVCELPICQDMRRLIRERLEAGDDEGRIMGYFVDRYGDRVLLAPPQGGVHLAAWLLPAAVVLAGALATVAVLAGWRRRAKTLDVAAGGVAGAYRARIEAEMERFRRGENPWT